MLWKGFVPSPVAHCFSSGIRTHRFCFLSHPSLPTRWLNQISHKMPWNYVLFSVVHLSHMPNTFLLEDCSKIPNVFLCFASQPSKHMDRSTKWQNPEKADIYKVPWQISHAWIDTYAGAFLLEKHKATTFFVLPLQSWMIVSSSRSTILVVVRIKFNHLFESCKITVTEINKTIEQERIDSFFFLLFLPSCLQNFEGTK